MQNKMQSQQLSNAKNDDLPLSEGRLNSGSDYAID